MENKTGLEKLLESLVHQSNGCGQGSERYILSGIIDYTKELIIQEKAERLKYLKVLQDTLYNTQQVMAGYSQDDTWSDYDKESHAKLILMQYVVEAEIETVSS